MERESMQEGSWIIDKEYGDTVGIGCVCRIFPECITAQFGELTCIRPTERFELAPLDIQTEDLKDMMELALMTKDKEWFEEISKLMKEGVQG